MRPGDLVYWTPAVFFQEAALGVGPHLCLVLQVHEDANLFYEQTASVLLERGKVVRCFFSDLREFNLRESGV